VSDEEKDFMSSFLMVIEVLWVTGVAVIFILYFVVKRRIKKKKEAEARMQVEERNA